MHANCKRSCNTCPDQSQCNDEYKSCQAWKDKSYCEGDYVGFMQFYCKRSCGLCDQAKVGTLLPYITFVGQDFQTPAWSGVPEPPPEVEFEIASGVLPMTPCLTLLGFTMLLHFLSAFRN